MAVDSSSECERFLGKDTTNARTEYERKNSTYRSSSTNKLMIKALVLITIASSFGNFLWAIRTLRDNDLSCRCPTSPSSHEKSLYAGLDYDIPIPFRDGLIFSLKNRSLSDAAWENWVVDPGIVALPHD